MLTHWGCPLSPNMSKGGEREKERERKKGSKQLHKPRWSFRIAVRHTLIQCSSPHHSPPWRLALSAPPPSLRRRTAMPSWGAYHASLALLRTNVKWTDHPCFKCVGICRPASNNRWQKNPDIHRKQNRSAARQCKAVLQVHCWIYLLYSYAAVLYLAI